MREKREREKKKKKPNYNIQSYSNRAYMFSFCNKFGYLQSFLKFNMYVFYVILCKFLHFLYFRPTDIIALSPQILYSIFAY